MTGAITLDQMKACVRREISVRERAYPGLVHRGKVHRAQADHEMACMRAVLKWLESDDMRSVLRQALLTAKKTIRALHGPEAWNIYEENSPEMKEISYALALDEKIP